MSEGEMVPIIEAARSLGVPVDHMQRQVERGQLPAVRDTSGQWLLDGSALGSLAHSQGLQLDLRSEDEPAVVATQSDVLAAQAAVLLAKTQAAAARLQSQDFFRRLRDSKDAAAADRQARSDADQALAEAERSLNNLRRDQAVAEAKMQELRKQLANDDRHFQFMVDRIASLEWERQRLNQCLGWVGRIKYRRLVQNPSSSPQAVPSSQPSPSALVANPHAVDIVDGQPDGAAPYPPPEPADRHTAADPLMTVQDFETLA